MLFTIMQRKFLRMIIYTYNQLFFYLNFFIQRQLFGMTKPRVLPPAFLQDEEVLDPFR